MLQLYLSKRTFINTWLRNTVLDISNEWMDSRVTNLKAVVAIDGIKVAVALALLHVVAAATHAPAAHTRCGCALP
jgi:hypothetical protein